MGSRMSKKIDLVDELELEKIVREIPYVFQRIMPSYFAGLHYTLREGVSSEWIGVREKKVGEFVPPRFINRRLSRRFGGTRIYRNMYESAEREDVHIFADISRSSTAVEREDIFLRLLSVVGIFTYAALENHDHVRVIAFNEKALAVFEKQELLDLRHFLERIVKLATEGFAEKSLRRRPQKSAFEQAALLALSQRRCGGSVIVISDFLDCVNGTLFESTFSRLARNTTLIPIVMHNREVERLTHSRMRFLQSVDPETGRMFFMNFFGLRGKARRNAITHTQETIIERLTELSRRRPFVFDETQSIETLIRYCMAEKRKKI